MKRFLALVVAGIVAAGLAVGARGGGLAVYRSRSLTFSYPAAWHWRQWRPSAGQLGFVVYVSNVALRKPCRSVGGGATECSDPLRRLPPGSALVIWTSELPPPGVKLAPFPLSVRRPGECRVRGADETVAEGFTGGLSVQACLRGPGLAARERSVRAMIASAHLGKP